MHNDNWDDLRFVLSVVETGSVLQAAKVLGVNHATVLRRIVAFEERHNVVLFKRTARGYRLLPDRQPLIKAAQEAQLAIEQVHKIADGGNEVLRGTVRITSTDTLCMGILPAFLEQVQDKAPHVDVAILSSNSYVDLMRDEAHITVRPAESLPPELEGKIVSQFGFATYARPDAPDVWLRLAGPLSRSRPAQWISATIDPAQMGPGADSFLILQRCAALGQGIAILPCFLGDADPNLNRVDKGFADIKVPIWVARHSEAIETQRIRVVQRLLSDYLKGQEATLLGRCRA